MDSKQIVGIYTSKNLSGMGEYYFVALFDNRGRVEDESIVKAFEIFGQNWDRDNPNLIGPFADLDSLNKWSYLYLDENNLDRIALHSVDEYNALLESNTQSRNLVDDMILHGKVIKNSQEKRGLLSKIFN